MITFAVIEKPKKEHKVRTPVLKSSKFSYKEMLDKKKEKERAQRAFMDMWAQKNSEQQDATGRFFASDGRACKKQKEEAYNTSASAAAAHGRAQTVDFFDNQKGSPPDKHAHSYRVRKHDEIPIVGDDNTNKFMFDNSDAYSDRDL